jgi:hypothetical protein
MSPQPFRRRAPGKAPRGRPRRKALARGLEVTDRRPWRGEGREPERRHVDIKPLDAAGPAVGFVPEARAPCPAREAPPPVGVRRRAGEGLQARQVPPVLTHADMEPAPEKELVPQQAIRRVVLERAKPGPEAHEIAQTLQPRRVKAEIDHDQIRIGRKIDREFHRAGHDNRLPNVYNDNMSARVYDVNI